MLPLLPDGTRVKIVKKRFDDVRPLDWVAFTRGDNLLAHEVLFKSKKYLVPWGVNNSWIDGVISPDQIVGVVEKKQIWRRWHLIYLAEAKNLLHGFEMAGIKNLILKGPPWQIAKYGYLLDKPSADIDWLIDKNEYRAVKKILMKRGYRLQRDGWVKKEFYRGAIPRVSEMSFKKTIMGNKLTIDLHLQAVREALTAWYKKPITSENMSRLTNHLLNRRKREGGWQVLPDTEGLFYLCLNLMIHHGGRGVSQLANIAHLIDLGRINWGEITTLARRHRVENYIYFPLLWSHRLFKVGVPILDQIKPTPVRLCLAKILINRWAIMRPTPSSKWLPRKINLLAVGYLRLALSGLL